MLSAALMNEPLDQAIDHVRGPAGAHVIVEYGDYECPYSRQAFRAIEQVEAHGAGSSVSRSAIFRRDPAGPERRKGTTGERSPIGTTSRRAGPAAA